MKMKVNFDTIEDAYLYVSMDEAFMNDAVLDKETGEIYFRSEMSGIDEFPDDINESKYISIPHKRDLRLGSSVALDFTEEYLPHDLEKVEMIFSRRGAYSKFKDLLEAEKMLEQWYEYENKRTREALIDWCRENNIDVSQ
jgi:hypothetical protein